MTEKDVPRIAPSEWKVMKIVWEMGSCVARDVYKATQERYGWAQGTAKVILYNMVKKGLLKTEQIANCYIYSPAFPPLESLFKEGEALIERAIEGTATPLISHIIRKGKLSPQEVLELRSVLDEYDDAGEPDE